MLAAELLQIDGYYQESRPILEAIHRRLDGEDQARIALRLGDARLHAEVAQDRPTFTESSKAWKRAPEELREIREILVRLLRSDPASMLGEVPRMAQLSNPRSDSGAEALYLLAQVDQILQQDEDAISEFGSWMRRFGSKVKGSDVPERFWTVYSQHVRERAEIGRWFEIAAMHESVWHKTVRRAVRDPEIMYLVARAYDEIGLVDEAMNVMTASIGIKPPEEDANADETIFYMADLQERLALEQMKLGQEKEAEKMFEIALEMLVPLKRSRAKIVSAGQLAMLEARMHEHMGNLDESAVYLRKAARYGEFRDEAQLKLSIMDAEAGRCRQAVPRLEKVLFEVEDPTDDPRPWLALARCLTAQGRGADAARAAQGAAERTSAPEEARYATWLAVVATGWDDEEQIENLVAGDDVWAAMAREQRDAVLFEEELMQRRKTEFTD
jgi:tetratricopeptide (TPR) repeat protein